MKGRDLITLYCAISDLFSLQGDLGPVGPQGAMGIPGIGSQGEQVICTLSLPLSYRTFWPNPGIQ